MPTGHPNSDRTIKTLVLSMDKETLQKAILKLTHSKNGVRRKKKKRLSGEQALKRNTK